MSEATVPNDGPYIVCKPLVGFPAGEPYTPVVKGNCFDCAKPMNNSACYITYDVNKLFVTAQCHKCGRQHKLLEATVTTLKCEPSSNPEPT